MGGGGGGGGDGGVVVMTVFIESSSDESSDDSEAMTLPSEDVDRRVESGLMGCCVVDAGDDDDDESRSVTTGNSLSRVSTGKDGAAGDDGSDGAFFAGCTMVSGWFSSRPNSASGSSAFSLRWYCCSAVTLFLLGLLFRVCVLFFTLDMDGVLAQ